MKLKAAEEKKLATAARKAEIVAKKQERQAHLIYSAEQKRPKPWPRLTNFVPN